MTAPNVELGGDPMAALDAAFEEAATTLSEPAADAPASPAAPPAPSPEATPDSASEVARDDKGRFAKRPETPAPAAATSDAPASDTPAPSAEPSPSPESAPSPEGEAVDFSGYPTFEYTAHGQPYSIPGSAVGEDGVFIPTPQVPYITRLLAEAHQNRDFGRELGRAVADAKREGETLKAEYTAKLRRLKEIATDPDRLQSFAENLERDWPLLEAEARLELEQRRRQELETQQQELERERAARDLQPKLDAALDRIAEQFMAQPGFQGLYKAEDRKELVDRLRVFRDQIFEEDPETGEVFVNLDVAHRELGYDASWRRKATAAQAQRQKIAQQNAATKPAPSQVPPTVGAKQGAAPSAKPTKQYRSATEADDDIWGKGFNEL